MSRSLLIALLLNPYSLILVATTTACAQAVDSVAFYRDRGVQLYHDKQYAQAYKALLYYMEHVSDREKGTEAFTPIKEKYYEAQRKVPGQLEQLYQQAQAAEKKGQQAVADDLYQTYLNCCFTPELQQTHTYTVILTQHALALQRKGKVNECISELERVVNIRSNGSYMDYAHVAETLNLIAAAEAQLGHYDQAILKCTEAAEIYRKRYGAGHEHYGTTLSNLASYYTSRNAPGDRKYAVTLGELAVEVLPKDKPAYVQAMNNLVVYYSLSGDIVKAQKYGKGVNKRIKKMQKNSIGYASILSNQAVRLANAGNYDQAIEYAQEAITIFESNAETQSLNYARLLSNAASFEKHLEHYTQAIALWQKAAPIFEQIQGKSGSGYLDCMSEISAAHAKTGDLEQAANINEQLQATASEQASKGDAHYARSLNKRAALMATDGNYPQAILLQQQAIEIFRLRKDTYDEASSLNDISRYFYHTNRLQEAIDTCLYALKLYETVPGHDEDRALAYNNLSIYYYAQENFTQALDASQQAVKYYQKSGNTQTSFFAKILTNQALYHARLDNLQQAITLSQRADTIQRQILGDMHPDNVMLMSNLANYYVQLGNTQQAQQHFHQALDLQMYHVRSNFSHLTTRGRELYWGTKSYIFRFAPYFATLIEDSEDMRTDAYNAQLFTKGLLLNSEIDFRNLLSRTASTELQEKYAELAAIHQQIERAWRHTPSEDTVAESSSEDQLSLSELTAQAHRLERELIRDCKEYGDFTQALNISYNQVAEALAPTDAAIEYFDIDTPEDGRTYYALLARHQYNAPKLIRLFSENDLNQLQFNQQPLTQALTNQQGIHAIFHDTRVGQLIWGRLIPYLNDVTTIYFAPSGILYQLGIEYLRYDQRRIDQLYNLHRLSSTKLLAQNAQSSKSPLSTSNLRHAALFGGLNYNATPSQLQAANQQLSQTPFDYLAAYDNDTRHDMAIAELRTIDSFLRGERREVGPLPGTRIEAELIGEALMQHNIDTDIYEGNEGTEEAFKNLSGQHFSLIHVATHGFALSEEAVRKDAKAIRYLDTTNDETSQADNSLCYSGLLMAGANNVLTGKTLPQGLENGVLTAREIAQLDLQGLDLAVLSACQTGLGELKEDGVFGLQRGFKKAGAHTLLMSLWSVDDEATQIMMTNFYQNLVSGKTKRQAFHSAQEAVRNNPRFNSPFYWASFIMLDD